MKKKIKKALIFFMILAAIVTFLYVQNNYIKLVRYEIAMESLPDAFEGYKIVQLSDLHNKEFGKGQKSLVDKIRKEDTDIIFITGDIVDSTKYNEAPALDLLSECIKIAPVYYVTGNHEYLSGKYEELLKKIENLGVCILEDKVVDINIKGHTLAIMGLKDSAGRGTENYGNGTRTAGDILKKLNSEGRAEVKVLLSHRPELFELYRDNRVQLIFTGHAHGGQVRLPFIGGIIAPDQGFFPKYDRGLFQEGNTTMVVSSGLGNSIIPQRIFNRPEVVVVTIKK